MSLLLLVCSESVWINLCFCESFLGKKLVDARSVFWPPDLWSVRHFVLFPLNHAPVNVSEESMFLQVSCIVHGSNTLCWVPLQKLLEQTSCFRSEVRFHRYRLFSNVSKHLLPVSIIVRRTSTKHFIKQSSKTPPVSTP